MKVRKKLECLHVSVFHLIKHVAEWRTFKVVKNPTRFETGKYRANKFRDVTIKNDRRSFIHVCLFTSGRNCKEWPSISAVLAILSLFEIEVEGEVEVSLPFSSNENVFCDSNRTVAMLVEES